MHNLFPYIPRACLNAYYTVHSLVYLSKWSNLFWRQRSLDFEHKSCGDLKVQVFPSLTNPLHFTKSICISSFKKQIVTSIYIVAALSITIFYNSVSLPNLIEFARD